MFQSVGRRIGEFRGLIFAAAVALASSCSAAVAEPGNGPRAVTLLIGRGTDTDFTQIISQPWTTNFVDLTILGAAVSTRLGTMNELGWDLGTLGDDISIEAEAGAAYRFGDESQGEFWGSLYLRYDGFPWNDRLYTTVALNTGLSVLTETSEFERDRSDGHSSKVLHNFSPEITFAVPSNDDLEWVLRLQHRSGIFGLIDGVTSGSTFVSTGMRLRF